MALIKDTNGAVLVCSTHPNYDAYIDVWDYIDRVITGRDVRKEILTLNPNDTSDANKMRNYQYKERAVFSRIAGRTANRMVGLAFSKYPTMTVPTELDYIKDDVDGAGASIYQQSQSVLKSVVSKGRAGLLVDYPVADTQTARYDMMERGYYATIQRFEPQQIIDWSLTRSGAKVTLGRVVIKDSIYQDGERVDVIRVLMTENGRYVSQLWQATEGEWKLVSEAIPTDGYGNTWGEIPFVFVGSETNQPRIDEPPMYDICVGNVCHYRLHADYMDSVHFVGQPQGYTSGIDDVKSFVEMQKENGWYTGSRNFAILPPGGTMGFAVVPPNTMVKEAMDSIRDTLMGMGAFFIMPGSAVKTATQAEGEQEEQHCILSLATSNVSEAYTKCLRWMCKYMRVDVDEENTPVYDIRRDFMAGEITTQNVEALWRIVMQGGIPKSDFWQIMRKLEIIDGEKTDDDIKDELEGDTNSDAGLNLDGGGDNQVDDDARVAAILADHPELDETAGA